jgi:predicted dienelactone hydrolase
MRMLPVLALGLTAACWPARDVTHVMVAGRDVAVWKPAGPAPPAGYPMIVFSHGFTGCNTQSVFFTEALAAAGYLVVAPNHADGRCGTARRSAGGFSVSRPQPEASFGDAKSWSDSTYRDRLTDIRTILDTILRTPTWNGVPVDAQRIGIAGHSLGGYTALGMAGAWPSWRDPRIKAALGLSPWCLPFIDRGDLGHLHVPVMYQGGTWDAGITPSVRRPGGAYDQTAAPKYYVELNRAGHLAWTDLNPRFQSVISSYSIAFFDRYVKGSGDTARLAALLRAPLPDGVSDVRSSPR